MFIGFHLLNKNDLLVIISILHRLQLRFWRFKKHLSDTKSYKQNDPESHKSGAGLSRHCGGLEADNIPTHFIVLEHSVWDESCIQSNDRIMLKPASLNL